MSVSSNSNQPALVDSDAVTLTIDIGGTGLKMLRFDAHGKPLGERVREHTPKPATPDAVLSVLRHMIDAQPAFDRVAIGFPGVIVRGVVKTAPNLGTEQWFGFDLQAAIGAYTGRPSRAINDADLQGYGVIEKSGLELVLTLGTGLGSALYVAGRLVPNLELGHHPFRKGKTYEELVSDQELEDVGHKRWRKRVRRMLDQLMLTFNPDRLYIGGGNASVLEQPLPADVHIFTNVEGMTGGVALWQDVLI
jgi:polyphosphate glucokinase